MGAAPECADVAAPALPAASGWHVCAPVRGGAAVRLLQRVGIEQLEAALGGWLRGQWTPDEAIAVDGKTLRGSADARRGRHLVAALEHASQVVGAQVEVDGKYHEIPALRCRLAPLSIAGRVVTADALHTQAETAWFLVEDQPADYLRTANDNHRTLKEDIARPTWRPLPLST